MDAHDNNKKESSKLSPWVWIITCLISSAGLIGLGLFYVGSWPATTAGSAAYVTALIFLLVAEVVSIFKLYKLGMFEGPMWPW
jgi:membrane protein YdbS with pleckstrin-like domain